MRRIRAFGHFWWDFVVGDDWRSAAGVVIAIGVTAALVAAGVDAWWLMPVAVAAVLLVAYVSVSSVTLMFFRPCFQRISSDGSPLACSVRTYCDDSTSISALRTCRAVARHDDDVALVFAQLLVHNAASPFAKQVEVFEGNDAEKLAGVNGCCRIKII